MSITLRNIKVWNTGEIIDLVVLDTAEEWTVDPEQFHSKARNTPFGGWQVTGRPLATIIGSKLMFSRL